MPEYHITWTIDLEAATPEAAAREALRIQEDPNSWGKVFYVTDEKGKTVSVDLNAMIKED
jgi:hypothetical protein